MTPVQVASQLAQELELKTTGKPLSVDEEINWVPSLADRALQDPYDLAVRAYKGAWILNYTDQVPRQLYRHFLFRMPSMYFSRVVRILSNSKIKNKEMDLLRSPGKVKPTDELRQFRGLWNEFVDTLITEWQTLNIVSALLLPSVALSISFVLIILNL